MNIYISNLSFDVTDKDLSELFAEYGAVSSAKVITDRYTGKSRGFGFVEMDNDEEAKKAIAELNQAEFDGKVITVNQARPKTEKPRGNYGGGNKGGYNSDRRSNRW
jgi:RNA recognition motif-containing protein